MVTSDQSVSDCAALLLFGATGDLAKRMLLPSLYALHEDELISSDLRIVGTARSSLSDDDYRTMAKEALETYLPEDRKDQHRIESVAHTASGGGVNERLPALFMCLFVGCR